MAIKMVPMNQLRLDGGTQPRVEMDIDHIDRCADAYKSQEDLPPLVVFDDKKDLWLADGFHRYHGAEKAKIKKITCDVKPGTQRDAILYSLGCNSRHGLPRSREDLRRSVEIALKDDEWRRWSDRQIAKVCNTSHPTVAKYREMLKAELAHVESLPDSNGQQTRTVERGGTTYEMTLPDRPEVEQQICPTCGRPI